MSRMSVALLLSGRLFESDSEEFREAPGAIRMIRSRAPTTETDLNIFGIIYSTLINLDVHQTEDRKRDEAMVAAALHG